MRRILTWAAAAAILIVPAGTSGRQSSQNQGSQQGQSAQGQPSSSAPGEQSQAPVAASGTQQDSLAAAARKAKAQLKETPKAAKVFTNDNLPVTGDISTVGATPTPESSSSAAQPGAKPASGNDEKTWRERFAKLHHKLDQDKESLAIMQRELGVLNVQYYSDPQQQMQQGLTRGDINQKTADIEAKKHEVEADQQAIENAEDELRKSGGDPGWAQ